ncbi:MAG: hypothetical protein IPM85_06170 [Chitinophagaceae bacterium]|nr:hypothetical protein [Chitinophagaceae bacterium]
MLPWANGSTGLIAGVSNSNSLVGSTTGDNIARDGIIVLPNSNYLVRSYRWHNGAVQDAGMIAWGNGNSGTSGVVGPANSLIGSSTFDEVGNLSNNLTILPNSNYIVSSPGWDKTPLYSVGAKTWGNGSTGVKGVITDCNSVTGDSDYDGGLINHFFNSFNGYLIVGKPSENKIAIFYPDGMAMANNADEATEIITGNTAVPFIVNPGCRIIASLTPNGGATMVNGSVTAKLWVESSVPTYFSRPYAARHHQITPLNNATSATGKITLYFTQQEFTDFNDHTGSVLDLPTDQNDAAGKTNLRILKMNGISNNGTGLPSSYSNGHQLSIRQMPILTGTVL